MIDLTGVFDARWSVRYAIGSFCGPGGSLLPNVFISMEHTFTDANFQAEVLKADKPVLVDFWAPWCGPCRMMAPIVDELAKELGSKLKVGKLNVDENQAMAQQFNIMSIPTFLVFKNGTVAEQLVGGMTKEAMKDKLSKHLD